MKPITPPSHPNTTIMGLKTRQMIVFTVHNKWHTQDTHAYIKMFIIHTLAADSRNRQSASYGTWAHLAASVGLPEGWTPLAGESIWPRGVTEAGINL